MIYSRFGAPCIILGTASAEDFRRHERYRPNKQDREAIALGSYVVCLFPSDGKARLQHLAYLRADGGSLEIADAIVATNANRDNEH